MIFGRKNDFWPKNDFWLKNLGRKKISRQKIIRILFMLIF